MDGQLTPLGPLRWVAETGSTNADLLAAVARGEGDQVLVADHQRAGRGRRDRRWDDRPGAALLVSVLVRADEPRPLLVLGAALALREAAEAAGARRVAVKWPNDVVVTDAAGPGYRKLAGVLAEVAPHPLGGVGMVIGVGVNVDWGDPGALPTGAVDLVGAGGRADRAELCASLLAALDRRLGLRAAELVAEHRRNSATLGSRVRVDLDRAPLVGTAVDLDTDGALVVADDAGARHRVLAGDVVHLRPDV